MSLKDDIKELNRLIVKRRKRLRRNYRFINGICIFMIVMNLIQGFLNVMRDRQIWVLQFVFCMWFTHLLIKNLKTKP